MSASVEIRPRRIQVAVAAIFVSHGLLFASWTAHVAQVKARLGIGDGTLGVALLGAPIGLVSAIGVAGWAVPRFGSRSLVQVALLGYCLSGPLVGLADSVPTLFAALLVWGAFMGLLDIAMNSQAITVERSTGRALMNGLHGGWSIGAFAGAGLGTLGVAVGLSLTIQLAVLGVLLLLGVGWLTVPLLGDRDGPRGAPASAGGAAGRQPIDRPDRTGRRLSATALLLGAIAFSSMLCEGAAADWASVYLRDSLGSAAVVAGLGYTSFALAMVTVRLLGNRLLGRFRAGLLLPTLATTAAVGFALALAIGVAPAAIVGFFLLGAGLGTVAPTAYSAAGRLPNLPPGVGVAVVSGLGWAGFALGPPLIGQLADAFSLPAALVAVPVLLAVIAIGTSRVRALEGP
ncbi:MFS transporter [uncultured Jatrophihabitans sp.]|uniref:MFS transporter n=1 Tax=uncultured Jatrophihabitans sp. TaxID=1610747 RepID=UPI0035C95946